MEKLLFTVVICLFIENIIANIELEGRLLTPQEGCGYSEVVHKRIVGGSEAQLGAWPWIARVLYTNNNGTFSNCGGSLITSRHVLTAAHCYRKDLSIVRVGDHDLSSTIDGSHKDIPIIHVEKHPAYNISGDAKNDIMLLYLENDVELTDRIRPICLPTSDNLLHRSFVGTTPFIAGWGTTTEGGKPATVLQQAQVPVLDNSVCKTQYKNYTIICAGHEKGGADSCIGDSGGPLMLPVHQNGKFRYYQIGVVSYGIGCARPNIPGVYTNVANYIDWITENVLIPRHKL